mmetsp:Transcript_36059/g.108978  ORF Transcript_36059/g.108978 Transcript_36059/m.108978 type:complete len:287 (-) Transcript_36059:2200-3060(-)
MGPSHGRPLSFAGVNRRFLVACCPPFSQPAQSDQSLRTQSESPKAQTWLLHARMLLSSPTQGFPPPLAWLSTARSRSCVPPPHDVVHCDQPCHSPRTQSAAASAVSSQGAVSRNTPSQALPSAPAWPSTLRSRVRWLAPGAQAVQLPQPVKVHGFVGRHSSFAHSLVSASGPLHCFPWHDASRAMPRPRRQRPSHATGGNHSDHDKNSQSCGSQVSETHSGWSSHFTKTSWAPSQNAPSPVTLPTTSASPPGGSTSVPTNLRTRLRQPLLPQLVEHWPTTHSSHTQ